MNRKIIFRGKNIHTGEWLYGDYHREGKTHYITKPDQYLREYAPIEFIVDKKTLGQFVGLLDKNQKRIYEGDIIDDGDLKYEVCWYDDIAAFMAEDVESEKPFLLSDLDLNEAKVIGNIHEPDISAILKESGEGVDELSNCLANELQIIANSETPYTDMLRTMKAVHELMGKDDVDPKETSWEEFGIYLDKLKGGKND